MVGYGTGRNYRIRIRTCGRIWNRNCSRIWRRTWCRTWGRNCSTFRLYFCNLLHPFRLRFFFNLLHTIRFHIFLATVCAHFAFPTFSNLRFFLQPFAHFWPSPSQLFQPVAHFSPSHLSCNLLPIFAFTTFCNQLHTFRLHIFLVTFFLFSPS